MRQSLPLLLIFLGGFTPAFGDSKTTPSTPKVTYEEHIKPIFRQHCFTCHNQGEKRGGLALDNYVSVIEGGGSGEVVFDDGDYDASRLWQLTNHDDTPIMPPNSPKIDQKQLDLLKAWIEGGILENSGSKAKAKKKNALAFVASSSGRPEGPSPMPEALPQSVPVLTERAAAITAIGTSPWAPLVAIAGQKQIVMYNTDTAELLGVLPFPEGIAQSLRFSRDGRYLIAGGGEHSSLGLVAIYEIKSGQRVATVGDELDVVFDADANDSMSRIALGGPQKMLRIYDATDGTQLFDLKKHTDWIYAVAFSPDGILVASGDRSGGLCVWEAGTGRLYLDLTDHKAAVTSISWRDDSNVLASASLDGTVKLWDMIAGKAVKSFNAGGKVTAVRFDHKGQLVTASDDKRVRVWDAAGKKIAEFKPMAEAALEAALTHESKYAVYGDWTGKVLISEVAKPDATRELKANPPAAKQRAALTAERLVTIRKESQPAQTAVNEAKQRRDALTKQLAEAKNRQSLSETKLNDQLSALAAKDALIAANVGKLQSATSGTRDAHDAVIAARVSAGDASDDGTLEKLAAAESSLAGKLNQLAALRRSITKDRKASSELKQSVATAQNSVADAKATVAKLTQQSDAAESSLVEAEAAFQAFAKQIAQLEAKHKLLLESS
ncbi:MAG: c-type cytochrome domain-containing protein [Planctomycetota bacterium]